jgi:hypothetical protein
LNEVDGSEIIPAAIDAEEVVQCEGADIAKGEVNRVMGRLGVSGRAFRALSESPMFRLKKRGLDHGIQNLSKGR